MTAYYNEIDEAACAVLRELIARDVIAPGDVDSRSIKDVEPDDLAGYTQCHFFAGGGLWSAAARLAGWPDDRVLWTGSCPCQPFSQAGKRAGADDPRHLWPDFHRLISAGRPPVVMGEQVAGADGYGWFDGVRADLARENYSGRAVDIPACAIDAPHQRNRLYWTAVDDRIGARLERQLGHVAGAAQGRRFQGGPAPAADDFLFADTDCGGRDGRPENPERSPEQRTAPQWADGRVLTDAHQPELRNGSFWSDAEWIVSPLDGKARRAKPGIPFLVDGMVGRINCWRIAGNGLVLQLAAEAIAAFLESERLT